MRTCLRINLAALGFPLIAFVAYAMVGPGDPALLGAIVALGVALGAVAGWRIGHAQAQEGQKSAGSEKPPPSLRP
jgi:membrane protein YqaA with SNARE-associated domain